ncbi:hypothetical protein GALMADRAFT_1291608 [Galerina marginata CBS 339.88]|uniref:Uncharacterized protein n=1 Tax=Galerina marginata (strain CBS 339.88) TaxID=685588 RepID=A0A067SFC4_GALM3|nr:hypothetical protein GALMADRAFT_1291608 [Galerina marginata CBS 339.88]
MRTPAQDEPHMSSYCSPASAWTPTKAAGGVETHPPAARAPHTRAPTQHEPHMSSYCLPASTPTPTKARRGVETRPLAAGALHMGVPAQHEPHMSSCCLPAGGLTSHQHGGHWARASTRRTSQVGAFAVTWRQTRRGDEMNSAGMC